MKQVFKIIGKAQQLTLDPRSRFFKRRFKSLKAAGYVLSKRAKGSVTLKLKDD